MAHRGADPALHGSSMLLDMRVLALALLLALLVPLTAGCECTTTRPTPDGGRFDAGVDGAVPPRDVMRSDAPFDPFDPDSACGAAAIPTTRIPGSLLLVFDRSSSMDEPANGTSGPSRWDVSEDAINGVLASAGDGLNVGLMVFPTGVGDACDVTIGPGVPHVPIAPLPVSRPAIAGLLAAGTNGGVTPIFDALRGGYQYLDSLDTEGPRGLILVTDGENNCDGATEASVLAEAREREEVFGYLTYAIGLDNSSTFLSTLAVNGGTRRNDTCLADCVAPPLRCSMTSPCPTGMGPCLFGFCASSGGMTAECCHYNVAASDFSTQLQAALDEIASAFLDSCVFELPRGADPAMFDPSAVNVGVTFEGESRTVVGRSTDPSTDSWNFTSTDNEAIVIQGALCDRLLGGGEATVEIVLGCPTIVF